MRQTPVGAFAGSLVLPKRDNLLGMILFYNICAAVTTQFLLSLELQQFKTFFPTVFRWICYYTKQGSRIISLHFVRLDPQLGQRREAGFVNYRK